MQDLTDKVRVALETYLYHGQAALASLREEPTEEFFAMMSARETAFQNFCALDALATESGWDFSQLPVFKQLWQEVDRLNRTLYGRMAEAKAKLQTKLSPRFPAAARRRVPVSAALRLVKHE